LVFVASAVNALAPRQADTMKLSMGVCPCETNTLCASARVRPGKEVVAIVKGDEWNGYDMHALTTIATERYDAELLCRAHSQGVRVLLRASIDLGDVSSAEAMTTWAQDQLHVVSHKFVDGVHVVLSEDCMVRETCVASAAEMIRRVKTVDSGIFVAVNVPWSPAAIDGHIHNMTPLGEESDIVIVTVEEVRRHIFDRCVASSHTPSSLVAVGMSQHVDLGMAPQKMILGLPWYGLDYPCVNNVTNGICEITPNPSSRAPCSDGSAYRVDLSELFRSNQSLSNASWDPITESWYATYQRTDGTFRQVWYDDTSSLAKKFQMIRRLSAGGIAVLSIPKIHPEVQFNLLKSVVGVQ